MPPTTSTSTSTSPDGPRARRAALYLFKAIDDSLVESFARFSEDLDITASDVALLSYDNATGTDEKLKSLRLNMEECAKRAGYWIGDFTKAQNDLWETDARNGGQEPAETIAEWRDDTEQALKELMTCAEDPEMKQCLDNLFPNQENAGQHILGTVKKLATSMRNAMNGKEAFDLGSVLELLDTKTLLALDNTVNPDDPVPEYRKASIAIPSGIGAYLMCIGGDVVEARGNVGSPSIEEAEFIGAKQLRSRDENGRDTSPTTFTSVIALWRNAARRTLEQSRAHNRLLDRIATTYEDYELSADDWLPTLTMTTN